MVHDRHPDVAMMVALWESDPETRSLEATAEAAKQLVGGFVVSNLLTARPPTR